MDKSVLISIRPEWCELIASGEKTIEVRKTRPKLDMPFKCYIYCTNIRPFLVWGDVFRGDWFTEFTRISGYSRAEADKIWDVFNGHIAGEFTCDRIYEIQKRGIPQNFDYCYLSLSEWGNDDIAAEINAISASCVSKGNSTRMEPEHRFCTAGISLICASTIRRVIWVSLSAYGQ